MEAYQQVYAPQEISEEQVWEEVEEWVNSLLDEGYDLSDYTWEEMYEAYIEEQGGNVRGQHMRGTVDPVKPIVSAGQAIQQGVTSAAQSVKSGLQTKTVRGRSGASRAAGGTSSVTKPNVGNIPPSEGTGKPGPGRLGNISPKEGTGRGGPSDIKAKPSGTAPTSTPTPTSTPPAGGSGGSAGTPAAGSTKPAGTPARASSPANASTADKIKGGMEVYNKQKQSGDVKGAAQTGMDVNKLKYGDNFAKPKTPNPLMKGMPGQNKAELDQIRGNAALSSISQSPSANRILSGTARSPLANEIGRESLKRSTALISAKPAPTPAAKPAPAASAVPANTYTGASGNAAASAAKIAAKSASTPPKKQAPTTPDTQLFHTDLFDLVKGYLLDEGYADNEESAIAIMSSMSEEWKDAIIEAYVPWDFGKGNGPSPRDKAARKQATHTKKGDTERAEQIGTVRSNMRKGINVTAKISGTDPKKEGTAPATKRHIDAAQRTGGIAGGKLYAKPEPGTPPSKTPSNRIPSSPKLRAKNTAAQLKFKGGSGSVQGLGSPSGLGLTKKFQVGAGPKYGYGGTGLAD
jgi:hypothetical protein